jgi:hypothetical protein
MNFDDKDLGILGLVAIAVFAMWLKPGDPAVALIRDIVIAIAGVMTGRAMNGNGAK